MDAAASTIAHRYRRFLFPFLRPPVPLGPRLPLLTVGDLLFSKKTYPNTCHLRRADTATQNGIRGLRAENRRISRKSECIIPQSICPRLSVGFCFDHDNRGLVWLLLLEILNRQFAYCRIIFIICTSNLLNLKNANSKRNFINYNNYIIALD